jgi:pimeloyl-ACP methyl ester carboxylesterase
MKKPVLMTLALFWVTLIWGSVKAQQPEVGKVKLEPFTFRTYDGKEHPAELGKLWVRENREGRNLRVIQLVFVRLSSKAAQSAAPIVFLAGGPGIPGIGLAQVPVYYSLFEKLQETADVILLDQRGTGMSEPNLQCPPVALPTDAFENTEKLTQGFTKLAKDCAVHWRAKGVELEAYNSNASADDLEDLREALKAERLRLLAWSYGTELALAAIRRHGNKIDQAVLISPRGPDHLLKLPSVWDGQVRKISALAAKDATVGRLVPDMEAMIKRVFDKLERHPIELSVFDRRTRAQVKLQVGKIALQTLIRSDLSDMRAITNLPALLYTIDRGDDELFKRRMEQLYNTFGFSAMGLAVDCAAGWSTNRLAITRKEGHQALMNNVNLQWQPEICKQIVASDLGATFRAKIASKVTTLFISGSLDPNAPTSQAEEIRKGFPHSQHVVIENGGHETIPAPEVQAVIAEFFKTRSVSKTKLSFQPPQFASVEALKSR